jgi:hypothetical protein
MTLSEIKRNFKLYQYFSKKKLESVKEGYLVKKLGLSNEAEYFLTDKAKSSFDVIGDEVICITGISTGEPKNTTSSNKLYDEKELKAFESGFLFL